MSVESFVKEYFLAVDSMKAGRVGSYFTENASQRFGNKPASVGLPAIKKANLDFFEQMNEIQHQIVGLATGKYFLDGIKGTIIMVELEVTYTKKDGSTLMIPSSTIIRMNRDKIQDMRIYSDVAELFR